MIFIAHDIFKGSEFLKVNLLVRQVREERKMSLNKLSLLSGVSIAHLSDIERNNKIPSLLIMVRLSLALKVSITDLFEVKL